MEIVNALQFMGFQITVVDNKIKYHFAGDTDRLDVSRASRLLAELKHQKQEALKYLYKRDSLEIAKNLVTIIQGQAISLGWTVEQLADLEKILPCFIPCQIGLITLQTISIELLYPDGSIRGSVTHYNHQVEQPWLKIV